MAIFWGKATPFPPNYSTVFNIFGCKATPVELNLFRGNETPVQLNLFGRKATPLELNFFEGNATQ